MSTYERTTQTNAAAISLCSDLMFQKQEKHKTKKKKQRQHRAKREEKRNKKEATTHIAPFEYQPKRTHLHAAHMCTLYTYVYACTLYICTAVAAAAALYIDLSPFTIASVFVFRCFHISTFTRWICRAWIQFLYVQKKCFLLFEFLLLLPFLFFSLPFAFVRYFVSTIESIFFLCTPHMYWTSHVDGFLMYISDNGIRIHAFRSYVRTEKMTV